MGFWIGKGWKQICRGFVNAINFSLISSFVTRSLWKRVTEVFSGFFSGLWFFWKHLIQTIQYMYHVIVNWKYVIIFYKLEIFRFIEPKALYATFLPNHQKANQIKKWLGPQKKVGQEKNRRPFNLHPLFLFWKHGSVCPKSGPKYGPWTWKKQGEKTGLFKKRRVQAASSLLE